MREKKTDVFKMFYSAYQLKYQTPALLTFVSQTEIVGLCCEERPSTHKRKNKTKKIKTLSFTRTALKEAGEYSLAR